MNSQINNFWNAILHDVNRSEKLKNNGSLYRKIVTDLIETLRLQFPSESIHVHYFGSRTVGLAGPDSDLDLYVDIGNRSGIYSDNPTKDVIEKGKSITKAIQSKPSTWVYLKNVGGRCPIVIVRHKISNIDCDISFSNSMTCGQNKLVTYIFELQPIARYMAIYLRGWTKENNINSAFRSHIVVLMVIFFLQVRGYLPTIYQLQYGRTPDVGPWITTFNKRSLKHYKMKEVNVGLEQTHRMLSDFFQYFLAFNFSKMVVCPFLGREVLRSKLKYLMPARCREFIGKITFKKNTVAIQDLVHLNHNKGAKIAKRVLDHFLKRCRLELNGLFKT